MQTETAIVDVEPPPVPEAAAPSPPVYLVFDTETTGLFQFKDKVTGLPVPADAPGQPRLASVAFILADAQGREVSRARHYIRPDGWSIDGTEAAAVNGLSDAFLAENGVPVAEVLDLWEGYIRAGLIAAAYNVQFDAKMMRAELRRAGRDDLFDQTPNTCLMRGLQPYSQRGLAIMSGMVKLKLACEFFGITKTEAHDAMGDAEAARAILEILIRDGNLIPPQVHRSKAREEQA